MIVRQQITEVQVKLLQQMEEGFCLHNLLSWLQKEYYFISFEVNGMSQVFPHGL